jgi:hypothetical protein
LTKLIAGDPRSAAVGRNQTEQQPHGGSFTRAVWTKQRKKTALRDLKRNIFDGWHSVERSRKQ